MESLSSGSSLDTAIELLGRLSRGECVDRRKGERKGERHGQNVLCLIKQANAVLFAYAECFRLNKLWDTLVTTWRERSSVSKKELNLQV